MATEIDSLQIKISADANKASNALDKLAKSLEGFQKSVVWDTGKLYSIGTGIKNIADAASGFKGAKSKELTSLSTALQNFNKVDTVSLRGVGSAMSELSKGMSGVQNIDVTGVISVANAVAKLGGKNASAGTKNLVTIKDDLVTFVRGLNSIGAVTFDTTGLANVINSVSKLGYSTTTAATKNLPILSAQLQNFVRQMNQIGSFNFDMTNLYEMVTAIGKLGSVASGRGVSNIPQLADNLNYMFTVLSKAPTINSNIIQMTNALANLARTGSSAGTASRSLANSLNAFGKSTKTAKANSFSLASAIGKVYATYWMLFRAVSKVKDAIDLSSDLTETENVVRQTFGNYESIIQDFVQTSVQQYGMSELTAKQVASRFQAMGTAVGYSQKEMSGMSLELTKLTGDLASFYNEDQGDVAKRLQSIFTGETEPMRRYGIDLTNATLKEYAMSKGLDSNISSMTQAEKVMLRYQYVMERTSNAQGDFARTSDTWANQVRMLQQAFEAWSAVVGGAVINAFKPFVKTLNYVMEKVISFTTTVTNALGKIFGWQYEVSDGGVADDWSESMSDFSDAEGDAADNAKKLKNNLLGIDELNVLSKDDDSSGSGSGSSGSSSSGATTGELVQVDTIFKDYESSINDLFTLGRTISDTLTSAMQSIDWDSIYEKARGFGTGLAQFLNGLITPDLFGGVGSTIAGTLNTAVQVALSFGQEFDFVNLGASLAQGVNDFFDTFNFENLGATINTWVQGLKDTIITFFDKVEWKDVFNGIKDTMSELDIETVTILVGAFTIKYAGAVLTKTVFEKLLIEKLVKKGAKQIPLKLGLLVEGKGSGLTVSETIANAFGGSASTIAAFAKVFSGIAMVAVGAIEAVKNFVKMLKDGFSWLNEILMVVGIAIAAVGAVILGAPALIAAVVAAIVAGVATLVVVVKDHWEEIKSWFAGIGEWFGENVIEPLKEKIGEIKATISDIWTAIKGKFAGIGEWFGENVAEPIANVFNGIATRIGQIFEGLKIIVEAIWIVVSGWFNDNVVQPVVGFFTNLWNDVKQIFSNLWNEIKAIWKAVSGWFDTYIIQPVVAGFKILGIGVKTVFTNLWNGIKTVWGAVSGWFSKTVINPVQNAWKKSTTAIAGFFTNLWDGIKNGVKSAFNVVLTVIESAINFMVDAVNVPIAIFNAFVDKCAKLTGADWGGVDLIPKVTIPKLETGGYVPNSYSMFMAGENGTPELMGTVGGKTAVAGGVEITGIRDAINSTAEAQMRMMQEEISVLKQLLAKDTSVNIGDREIARANIRGQKSMGLQIIT